MNDKNECIILGSSTMEKREGAPGLPTEGRASVGPVTTLQISQKEAELIEHMDVSSDSTVLSSIKIEQPEKSPAHQKSPSYLNRQLRTNMSVVSNCVVSSPTKMIHSPSVGLPAGISTLCDSGSGTSQTSTNSSTSQCNASFAMSKKRLKLSENLEKTTANDEIFGIRKRILEHKLARMKSIREKHNENAAELFYLESGGNMMDYHAWRKRPHTPQLLSFIRSHSLEKTEESTDQDSNKHPAIHAVPRGAEIKISGVGVTPVAVSTTLPAAVTQLTQQGGTPLIIENSGVSRLTSNHTSNALQTSSSQEQIVEKAKHEAFVMQRISELQKEGLWTEKRLPKVVEPSRPKAHWDYLLEEMVWLATDFAQERKWKKAAAKKCARMIQKYFQEKELSSQRAEKAQEHQLRRVAAFIAKEVRSFWINVEKLVEYRQQTRLEEKRKQALDQQLNFIVDQTEKYSQQLAEGLRSQNTVSKQSSSKASSVTVQSDGEFCPSDAGSSDDEETIAAAEREETEDSSRKEELEALQRESQMDLDEFLNELPQDYLENRDKIQLSENESGDESDKKENDSEFQADEDSTDDEDTIMEQEKLENCHDYEKEIDELNAENEMSIEELKKKYSTPAPGDDSSPSLDPNENSTKSDNLLEKGKDSMKEEEEENDDVDSMSESEESISSDNTEDEESEGLDALMNEGDSSEKQTEDHRMEDAAAIAESIQPTGNTLSSTQVVTKVPFLLKHSLREYQHIGLDWLVTMEQRRLNGILADEMGLGKTIQTIALLAHLACEKGDWGPHLIVVPTSVMLNWEMEFKKWCPGFKILTYYGNQKERKLKRIGWTKYNAFHICITSYKLVIQDHQSFRRKKWKYLILDEAQNIKNFKSQRWQLLLNFKTQQRLLLTGTPLQNNLMELWSLMHFLMPDIFASHNEFKEWFSNPVTGMIEGNSEYNENVIKRLHKVLRPFLLRRLKCEVEKQMPKKYEHVVICRLSKRQRFLYDDFMSRAKTKETLACGNLLSVINILMQLRKVCNHPNLFEVRPTISPFQMEGINYHLPSTICNMKKYNPLKDIDLATHNLNFLELENISAFESYRVQQLKIISEQVMKVDSSSPLPPPCPRAALRIHVSLRPIPTTSLSSHKGVAVGTSPRMPPLTVTNIHNSQQSISTKQCIKLPSLIKKESILNPVSSETSSPHTVSLVQPLTSRVLKQLSSARTSVLPSEKMPIEPVEKKKRSEFYDESIEHLLKNKRKTLLNFIYDTNEKRCDAYPIYGSDLRDACTMPKIKFCDTIQKDINTIESYMQTLHNILDRFIIYICGAMSIGIRLHVGKGAAWRTQEEKRIDCHLTSAAKPALKLFSKITSNMTTQFPDPRLIQYDCGKLQTLDLILRKLKCENHKVLIFTQMTKMLDVLEAFLNFHGHIYLRLDGTTKIEQRQILMERFNADKRIFAFILSTRSGGVGVNLTGADTVIFYDSDWNPTMDAQAQDRCHRIGQTRDVHIYRLISEKTIEENILKKANQKRLLGDVAIEGGNFTTAYFKSSSIQDLFTVDSDEDAGKRLQVSSSDDTNQVSKVTELVEDNAAFENALAQCEDEADVAAATTARAEADAELAEFDESIPIEEPVNATTEPAPELTKAEQELELLMQELSPIERYGIRLVEASEAAAFAEQQAIAEMEKQKRDWETARRLLERSPSPMEEPDLNNDDLLTFPRDDSINQVWISANTNEIMTVWYPPTPPQGDGDIYIDSSLAYLYDWNIMLESQLPPVYVKRDNKRPRAEMGHSPDSRRPSKSLRRDENLYMPRSLFEKPAPALVKMRRDLKLQKYRNMIRPTLPIPGIKPSPKSQGEPEFVLEWTLLEDKCLLDAVKSQGLPLNLITISPAHTHNWYLVSDLVNNYSRIYRSYRQCKYRYETVILPREEGKLMDANQKKQKKSKSSHKSSRSLRTSHLYEQDNNVSFTKDFVARYDVMKSVFNKKTITTKRRYDDTNNKNPKHVAVLSESGINYDKPCNPMEIAQKRADRIAKEKLKTAPATTTVANEQAVAPSRLQNISKVTSSPPLGTSSPLHAAAAAPSPRPPQRILQGDQLQRQQRIVVTPQQGTSAIIKGNATGTLTTGGKPLNSIQYYRHNQSPIRQQLKVFPHATGSTQGNIVQQINVSQQANKISPLTVTSIQVSTTQQRPQITQATIGKQTITRAVTDLDINVLIKKQQAIAQQKNAALQQPVTQIFTSQQQLQALQAGTSERVAVTVGGPAVAMASGNVTVASPGTKIAGAGILTGVTTTIPGKAPMKMATPQQIRQLQLQPLALAQRKGQKVTQLAQMGGGAQVIVQAPGTHKTLPPGMTMQQIHQVMRQFPNANTRVVPRQTIQVVGSSVGQVRTAGVTSGASHQVILSQVSAALQARQPTPASTPTSTATVRPTAHPQPPADPQPKP